LKGVQTPFFFYTKTLLKTSFKNLLIILNNLKFCSGKAF